MQIRRTTPTPGRRRSLKRKRAPEVNSTGDPHPATEKKVEEVKSSCCLHLDVIGSILAKLPIKSILRFRSVCKLWKQLICDPTFIKLHRSVSSVSRKPRILLLSSDPNLGIPNFDFDFNNIDIGLYFHVLDEDGGSPDFLFQLPINYSSKIVTTRYDCDGLVLIHSREDICVCNPSTRETIHLAGFSHNERRVQSIGFGLDPSTNLYKVVRFFFHKLVDDDDDDDLHPLAFQFQTRCEVFTLGSEFQSWRQVDDPPYGAIPISDSASVNGRIYWRTLSTDCILLSFDLRNEDFRVLPPPSTAKKWEYFIMNGGQGQGQRAERLWFVKINRVTFTYDIWELNESTHSWKIIHRIGFHNSTMAIPTLVIGDGRLILLSHPEKLQRYDIVSKERKTILFPPTFLLPSLYRESLVSFRPTN